MYIYAMKQRVQILGMTCQNCRRGVEEKIASIEGLSQVEVSLEKAEASFNSSSQVSVDLLAKTLGSKYTVNPTASNGESVLPSKWKQLRPLFLIFSYVIIGSVMLTKGDSMALFMTNFMGLFYVIFGFFKFLDYPGFPASFGQYDPIAKRIKLYGWAYPFIETLLGIMFLYQIELEIALWITIIILGTTTVGVAQQLLQKNNIKCACLGTALNLPMTEATLIENSIMLVMAFSLLSSII